MSDTICSKLGLNEEIWNNIDKSQRDKIWYCTSNHAVLERTDGRRGCSQCEIEKQRIRDRKKIYE